jgi:hypothetical protein
MGLRNTQYRFYFLAGVRHGGKLSILLQSPRNNDGGRGQCRGRNADTNADGHTNTYCHTNSDIDPHADTHSHPNPDCNADAHSHANTHSRTDTFLFASVAVPAHHHRGECADQR